MRCLRFIFIFLNTIYLIFVLSLPNDIATCLGSGLLLIIFIPFFLKNENRRFDQSVQILVSISFNLSGVYFCFQH